MKKAKLDSTIEAAVVVAPHDVDLEEDDIDVVDVDVKIEGEEVHVKSERERWSKVWKFFERLPIGNDGRERAKCDEELSLEELTDDVMQMDNKDTKVEDV
ncbi:unnamed protein product [Lactuca saligna]|uniref:Uncharacterized protein n=1 Tax=Lactuca saligna TaxID=75948 RepID=A0AA35VSD0_LACSI|nr:unnamed protein product [Lactuca saligna]